MLVVCFVIAAFVDVIYKDAPRLEWRDVVSTRFWDHSVVVGLNSEVKVSVFLRNDHCEIVFEPRGSVLNIIPVVGVAIRISIVSYLDFIEAT